MDVEPAQFPKLSYRWNKVWLPSFQEATEMNANIGWELWSLGSAEPQKAKVELNFQKKKKSASSRRAALPIKSYSVLPPKKGIRFLGPSKSWLLSGCN